MATKKVQEVSNPLKTTSDVVKYTVPSGALAFLTVFILNKFVVLTSEEFATLIVCFSTIYNTAGYVLIQKFGIKY